MSRVPRLSDVHIRKVHCIVEASGAWSGFELFTEEQYDDHLRAFLTDRPEGPIGVFAYGSPIWKPVFEPTSTCRATASGWHKGIHAASAAVSRQA